MVPGALVGGILELTELINGERRPQLTRDFREKFGISLYDIGLSVRYDEALTLVYNLSSDPTSWFHASLAGWSHPLSFEGMLLLELVNVETMAGLNAIGKGKKYKPYPAPWPDKSKKTIGTARPAVEALAILRPTP